tara:strand:+ start:46 stop:465 length:420 start_codon:yes stop_codon:yes gene_type:complete
MTKKCKNCGKYLLFKEFHSNGRQGGKKRYKPRCRKCINSIARTQRNKLIKTHFGKWKCSRCGFEGRPIQFDCHHARGIKRFKISENFRKAVSSKNVFLRELEKCDLLCANCHRLEHEMFPIETKPFTSKPIRHDINRIL